MLAIPELDSRFLHDHSSDAESDCGRLLGSTLATEWYKVHPWRIKTHEITVFCVGCIRYQAGNTLLASRYLHNRFMDTDSVCGRLLDLTQAFQWYKVHLCRIEAQEIAVFCGEDLYCSSNDILLDGRLLHNQRTDFQVAAICRGLLGLIPASQW